ncbi:hypothetical protein OS189_00545 [Sulfitobacter sp. F26169L]|uniref:hypothetical protein n=1 Tax=Sulfitobacter sp. F26169L TaxID=2996015 RepID=UPI002260A7CF|nr:hypothetical protein [Sulfitobacter sp. F26169L]MCX7564828.1 hypothetical protein [Sulfitobacter sp. F26169L]
MKQILAAPLVTLCLVTPLHAEEEPPSLMERGAQLFFEGLKQEMAPALEEMSKLIEEAGPALQDFLTEMGPKLRSVLEDVQDWSVYSAPEKLPNGDIIIRRKPDAPEETPPSEPAPQIDL